MRTVIAAGLPLLPDLGCFDAAEGQLAVGPASAGG